MGTRWSAMVFTAPGFDAAPCRLNIRMQESEAVFEAILTATNRRDAARMLAAQRYLKEVAGLIPGGTLGRTQRRRDRTRKAVEHL
jgi:hypothetical protein